jgi:hypothetical protein
MFGEGLVVPMLQTLDHIRLIMRASSVTIPSAVEVKEKISCPGSQQSTTAMDPDRGANATVNAPLTTLESAARISSPSCGAELELQKSCYHLASTFVLGPSLEYSRVETTDSGYATGGDAWQLADCDYYMGDIGDPNSLLAEDWNKDEDGSKLPTDSAWVEDWTRYEEGYEPFSDSSIPPNDKKGTDSKAWQCLDRDCNAPPFERSADLSRHYRQVHFTKFDNAVTKLDWGQCSKCLITVNIQDHEWGVPTLQTYVQKGETRSKMGQKEEEDL